MPIPTYQPDEQPQALPTPYSNARVSPDAAGEATGQALQQGGNVLQEIVHHARVKADTVANEDGYSRVQGSLNARIFDPKTGYLGLKGTDAAPPPGTAIDAAHPAPIDQYLQAFNKDIDGVMSGLANDDQRRELGWRVARLREAGTRAALEHERQQQGVVGAAVHAGAQDAAVQAAANVASNPNATDEDLRTPFRDVVENSKLAAVGRFGQSATDQMIKSVALPDLQRAGLAAMKSALDSPNVGIDRAKKIFGLYGDYLGPQKGHFEAVLAQMQSEAGTARQALGALQPALTPVVLPGGDPAKPVTVQRIDYTKLSTVGMSPDAAKLVEQQQANYEKLWTQTVGQVVENAKTAGTTNGVFTYMHVPVETRTWLDRNDPTGSIALKALEDREDARARAADRADARELFNQQRDDSSAAASLVSAQIVDKDHRDKVLKTTPEEFQVQLMKGRDLDGDPLPAPLMQKHLAAVVKTYRQAQKDAAANQLDEKPEATVKAAIARAADDDPDTIKDLNARYFSSLAEKAKALIASKKGSVTTEDLAKYIDRELATGTVKGSGIVFDDSARRIESETLPKYRGKQFVPAVEELGAEAIPPQPTTASVVAPAPKTVRGYKYTSDRKQRSPVFSDGSQGPLEASP